MQSALILSYIQIAIFILLILLALVYLIPVLLVRRFQTLNNAFTVNLCCAAICCGTYWLLTLFMSHGSINVQYSYRVCTILNYFEMVCTLQVPFAIVTVSVYRLCCVVYHTKAFFRRRQWIVLCIASQWTTGFLIALPRPLLLNSVCVDPHWMGVYAFLIIVVVPAAVCLIINIIIFSYVRSSTNRVDPSSASTKSKQCHRVSRRDLRLLRHMIVMLCVFVGGWAPIYLYSFIAEASFNSFVFLCMMLLAETSVTLDIINLFVYNHELRRFLVANFFFCRSHSQ